MRPSACDHDRSNYSTDYEIDYDVDSIHDSCNDYSRNNNLRDAASRPETIKTDQDVKHDNVKNGKDGSTSAECNMISIFCEAPINTHELEINDDDPSSDSVRPCATSTIKCPPSGNIDLSSSCPGTDINMFSDFIRDADNEYSIVHNCI